MLSMTEFKINRFISTGAATLLSFKWLLEWLLKHKLCKSSIVSSALSVRIH